MKKKQAEKPLPKNRPMKRVGTGRLVQPISEARILQLSNDLSENIASGTVKEWRSVAYYFRQKLDTAEQDLSAIQTSIVAATTAEGMRNFALVEMSQWVKRRCAKLNTALT
jgi:hypothetical protein